MKAIRLFCFFCFLVFGLWAYFYGENLPVNPDTFSEWFSGKFVLVFIAGMFLTGLILSLFEKKGKKKLPMATPKRR